jgi:histidinol phosphatase-like PHP family hydrolase
MITDFHAHTNMSYCAANDMTPEFYVSLLRNAPALDKVAITDHGMALYFPEDVAWRWEYISDSSVFDKHRNWGNGRLESHLKNLENFRDDGILLGLEVEMMNDGRITCDPCFRDKLDVMIASVHYLPVSVNAGFSGRQVLDFWLEHMEGLFKTGANILGHPFRWLAAQIEIPYDLVEIVVKKAKDANMALELNSHFEIPTDVEMLKEAVKQDAKIVFGSDAHSRDEAGDFSYHFDTLIRAGLKLEDLNFYSPN